MADFLTHILLSDDVLERIESRRVLEGIQRHRTLYRLGAQGPDPLFFYNLFPGMGKDHLRELGRTMHRQHTGEFLKMGFAGCKTCPGIRNGWSLQHTCRALSVTLP